MSVADRRLFLMSDARRDLRSISIYTKQRWGAEQQTAYRLKLNNAFALICVNPEIGPLREDLKPSIRERIVERHVIYYRVEPETIRVLRVVHGRMNPSFR